MKSVKAMPKSGIADFIATAAEIKKSQASKALAALGDMGSKEVKKGKFVIPGVCMVKTRLKPATKAGKREVFGKVVMVKAKPARTIVKAFPVAALKNSV